MIDCGRYVEVFEAVSRDVARAKDKEASRRVLKEGFSVNLRGLPYRSGLVVLLLLFKKRLFKYF